MNFPSTAFASAILLCTLASPAFGQDKATVVLPVQLRGKIHASSDTFTDFVRAAAVRKGKTLLPKSKVQSLVASTLSPGERPSNCLESTTCAAEMKKHSYEVLQTTVDADGAYYFIQVTRTNLRSGDRQVTNAECSVCTISDVEAKISEVVTRAASTRSVLAPTAPIIAENDVRSQVAPTEAFMPSQSSSGPKSHWKWISATAAGFGLVTGIALLSAHGNAVCPDTNSQCPRLRDNKFWGTSFLVAGTGLAATSGWLFYRESQREMRGTITPMGNGVSAGISGTF